MVGLYVEGIFEMWLFVHILYNFCFYGGSCAVLCFAVFLDSPTKRNDSLKEKMVDKCG